MSALFTILLGHSLVAHCHPAVMYIMSPPFLNCVCVLVEQHTKTIQGSTHENSTAVDPKLLYILIYRQKQIYVIDTWYLLTDTVSSQFNSFSKTGICTSITADSENCFQTRVSIKEGNIGGSQYCLVKSYFNLVNRVCLFILAGCWFPC